MVEIEEKYLKLDQWDVYYSIVGRGPHVVLFNIATLFHAPLSIKFQLHHINKDIFTVVVWDPPGYGKSRPPEKEITAEVFFENAQYAFRLMKALNFDRYSVWGYCGGGVSAMILAAQHPETVRALLLTNTRSHILQNDIDCMKRYENIDKLGKAVRDSADKIFGRALSSQLWASYIAVLETIHKEEDGNICTHLLEDIKCPTLVLGGGKDPLVDPSHALHLHEHIQGSELFVDPEWKHCPHWVDAEDFNKKFNDFFLKH